jgi:hypothetical protein
LPPKVPKVTPVAEPLPEPSLPADLINSSGGKNYRGVVYTAYANLSTLHL